MFYLKSTKILCLLLLTQYLTAFGQESPPAQKEVPNYDFSLENLKTFFPSSTRAAIERVAGKGTLIKTNGDFVIRKYYVAQLRYKFPVFVQFYQNQSIEFFARLPTYFLHDLFHQALINRYGNQDQYVRLENSALYVWKNAENNLIIYNGMCTQRAFPVLINCKKTEPTHENYRSLRYFLEAYASSKPSEE